MEAISSMLKERHGEITRVLRELGHGEAYLRKIRRREKCEAVKLGKVGAILEVGEIPPETFWPRAFPEGCDPVLRFTSEATLLERRLKVPKVLHVVRDRHAGGELLDTPHNTRASDIDELWQERLVDAGRAGRRASMMARYATERPFAARALGVWAGVLRMRGDLSLATVVLGAAIDLAEGYRPVLAELAQRSAYVLSDRGRFQEAIQLAQTALVTYAFCGDLTGTGRALVDSGIFHYRNDDFEEAIAAYIAAITFLPAKQSRNLCSAHHGLAVVYTTTGNLHAADHHLKQALDVPHLLPEIDAARFFWLRARIARARGEHGQAVLFFEKTLSSLDEAPADYAVVATELVALKLQAGQAAEAVTLARSLTPIALQIDNELVEAAVASLILSARQGELTIDVTEALIREMENGGAGASIPRPPVRPKR